jgi:hypothetical protein
VVGSSTAARCDGAREQRGPPRARPLRGDDWLGSTGTAEIAVLLSGGETAAKTATERLVRAVAALSLTSARRVGAGTVIR